MRRVLASPHATCRFLQNCSFITNQEIGAYFGMKGSAVSQLSRRFEERIKGDRDLRGTLDKIRMEALLNVET